MTLYRAKSSIILTGDLGGVSQTFPVGVTSLTFCVVDSLLEGFATFFFRSLLSLDPSGVSLLSLWTMEQQHTTHFSLIFFPQWLPGGRVCLVLSTFCWVRQKSGSSFSSPKSQNTVLLFHSSLSLLRERSQPMLISV